MISGIVRDRAIPGASESLLVWGSVNLLMWFVQYGKIVQLFIRIDALSGTFTFVMYGGCVIAVCMLAFGVVGQVTKSSLVGHVHGIALVAAGLWNLYFEKALADAVRSFGYTLVEKGFDLFGLLGLFQILWGLLQLYGFWRFGFQPGGMSKTSKDEALAKVREIIQSPAKPEAGRFKVTIPASFVRSLIPGVRRGGAYTVWLLPRKACWLHDNLEDYFEYDRRALAGLHVSDNGMHQRKGDVKIQIGTKLNPWKGTSMVLDESAFKAFHEWLSMVA